METVALVVIAVLLAALLVVTAAGFAMIIWVVNRIVAVMKAFMYAKKFFKQIERIRRDFS